MRARTTSCLVIALVLTGGCSDLWPWSKGESNQLSQRNADTNQSYQTQDSDGREGVKRRPPSHAITSDALLVNDFVLTVKDVLEPIHAKLNDMATSLPSEIYLSRASEIIRRQLMDMVAEVLIYGRAQQKITEAMEPNIEKAIRTMERDRIEREFGGRETRYEKFLQHTGKTREEVQERLRRAIVVDSYLKETLLPRVSEPNKRELLAYYQDHIDEYTQAEQREMFLIDAPVKAFLEAEVINARRRPTTEELGEAALKARGAIDAAMRDLQAGQPFEEVAKKYSKGIYARNGGAWGFISAPLKNHWEAPSKQLFKLKEGAYSEIIEAADSFFIVKLGQLKGGKMKSFQEAQPEIVAILKNRAYSVLRGEFLQNELERATIGSLDSFTAEIMKAIPASKSSASLGRYRP